VPWRFLDACQLSVPRLSLLRASKNLYKSGHPHGPDRTAELDTCRALRRPSTSSEMCHIRICTADEGSSQKCSRLHIEPLEQRPCVCEIGRIEAFGEPAADWCDKVAGFGVATLVAAEPGEAYSGA